MELGRRAYLEVTYNGANITPDLKPHLKGWSYTDNMSGQADDLQITLEDQEHLWISDWFPDKGTTLSATAVRENWDANGQRDSLNLGVFEIDEIETDDFAVTIKALSIPEGSGSMRGEEKNKAWENITLSGVAGDVAGSNGMSIFFDSDYDPFFDRLEQTEQTDLVFLQKQCDDAGLSLKIGEGKILIFDDAKYEEEEAIATINRSEFPRISFQAKTTLNGIYSACTVEYTDASQNETIKYTFSAPNAPATGKILRVNQRVTSVAEAESLAKRSLRKENIKETDISLTLPGDTRFLAALTVMIVGWGVFDGKYIITQAAHSQQGKYDVKLQLRRCLEGY
ncbi:MAG: hypothetical protein APF81_08555 [Desulfosporosinus sp. BRH_c37]|nr:MAG: hypothetical protein APF81_08555 [Desulfosporosinus sp. BRH_c37]